MYVIHVCYNVLLYMYVCYDVCYTWLEFTSQLLYYISVPFHKWQTRMYYWPQSWRSLLERKLVVDWGTLGVVVVVVLLVFVLLFCCCCCCCLYFVLTFHLHVIHWCYLFVDVCVANSVAASLFQVPNQPCVFSVSDHLTNCIPGKVVAKNDKQSFMKAGHGHNLYKFVFKT